MKLRLFIPFVMFGALLSSSLRADADVKPSAAQTVVIENMVFTPAELNVSSGTKVTWVNKDLVPHTVTFAGKNSGSIAPSASWSSKFTKKGSFPYKCSFHPTMAAKLVVK